MEHESATQQFGEEGFGLLVQNAPDLILVLDAEGREMYASPSCRQVIGAYTVEEREGKSLLDFIHPEDAATAHSLMAELLTNPGGTSPKTELRVRSKDGSLRYFESTGTNLLDEPSVAGIVINARDVTERKLAEREHRDYEERLRMLANAAFEGILISEDGVILEINQAMAEMLGYTREELVGEYGMRFIAPEYRETVAQSISSGSEEPYEIVGIRKDGARRDLEVRGRAFVYRDRPVRVTAIRDITERKRSEEALKQSEERFQTIFDQAPLGISIADPERRLLETNPAYQELTGYTAEELHGKPIAEISHPEDVPADEELNQEVSGGNLNHYRSEKRYVRRDGEVVWVQPTVSPVRNSEGKVRFLIGLVEDITGRKRAEEELRESNRRLKQLAAMKADFTAMVAHELDAPLAVVRGFLDVLEEEDPDPEDQRRVLSTLQAETDKMVALVSDVREAAVVERDDFAVRPRPVPAEGLLAEAARFARSLPGNYPVEVEFSPELPEDAGVVADPGRVGQVLRNLVSNAAKYSPEGEPITLHALPEAGTGRIRFEVADRGPGISSEDRERIFEKFGRGRDAAGRRMPGVGLGLYISRRIIRAHGGKLDLDSVPGEGSTFGFSLEKAR